MRLCLNVIDIKTGNLERHNHHNICVQLYSAGGGQAPALGVRSRIKVECREFAVVFFSGGIIGFGCLLFLIEAAEIYLLSVDSQYCLPWLASFVPGDAFVLGEAFRFALAAVPAVLLAGGGP